MRFTGTKAKTRGAIVLMMLAAVELSAQQGGGSISWTLYSAVPLSDTMMGIMAALFLVAGTWMLLKMQKQGMKLMAVALLALAASNVPSIAARLTEISITTDSSTAPLECGWNELTNNHPQNREIIITDIELNELSLGAPALRDSLQECEVGLVLASGEMCEIYAPCEF